MKNTNGSAKGGGRFSTSLVVGMLLVPLSAVAAVALVNPDAAAEPEEVVAAEVVVETTSTTIADEIVVPEIASDGDLAAACGDEGWALVTKEAEGTISPLEQAALDSLRAICLSEGLELPGPPAPEAVVQTVTVVAGPATPSSASSDEGAAGTAAEFEAEYAATVAHINAAIADGANGEKIALAEQFLAEAGSLADAGDYEGGMEKLEAARQAADQADRGGHHDDDDDYDDDDDDDDDHDDDDDDDDHDEDDEDDDDDEDEDDEEDEKEDH